MEQGIPPTVANKRLRDFQQQYTQIEEKWQACTNGEELFGLPITDYKELSSIKSNLKYLDKLYSLYNEVISQISGLNDKSWADTNFEEI